MTILKIARQEFNQVAFHPLVVILALITLVIAIINGVGYGLLHAQNYEGLGQNFIAYRGMSSMWGLTMAICLVMSAFFGAVTIPYDRWKHSYNVLLAKPLYRRDIIVGKFVGLSAFMFLFSGFAVLIAISLVIACLNTPLALADLAVWTGGYILLTGLTCSTIIALNLLIGTISKNLLIVTTLSFVYISVELFWYKDWLLLGFDWLMPLSLAGVLVSMVFQSIPYPSYMGGSLLIDCTIRVAALLMEVSGALLLGIYLFTREDI